jgi:hypothetical protein
MDNTPTSIADIPRYGAATLNGTPSAAPATTGGSHIRWGGVVKGAVIVGSAVLVAVAAWYGVGLLMGSTPSLSIAATQIGNAGAYMASQIGAGFTALSTFATSSAWPWVANTAVPGVIGGIGSAGAGLLHGVSWVLTQCGLTGVASAIAPAAVNNTLALTAGIATASVAAVPAIHALSQTQMIDHSGLQQIAEHTVTHHAAEHTVEDNTRHTTAASKLWADRVGGPSASFGDKLNTQTAKLDKALNVV